MSWCSAHSCLPCSSGYPFVLKCAGTPNFPSLHSVLISMLVLHGPHSCDPCLSLRSLYFQATKSGTSWTSPSEHPQPYKCVTNSDPLFLLWSLTRNTRVLKPATGTFLHSSFSLPHHRTQAWLPTHFPPTQLCLTGYDHSPRGLASPPLASKLLKEGHIFLITKP